MNPRTALSIILLFPALALTPSFGAARAQERPFDITDTTAVLSAPRTGPRPWLA